MGEKSIAQIVSDYNKPGLLEKILGIYDEKNVNLYSIEGRVIEKDARGLEKCQFDLSFDNSKPSTVQTIEDAIRGLNLSYKVVDPPLIDWFPLEENGLDHIGKVLSQPGDGLNQDHPGFKDEVYKKRRNFIGDLTLGYQMKDPIPYLEYTEVENKVWKQVYNSVKPFYKQWANKDYLKNFKAIEEDGIFTPEKIPQLEDINVYLKEKSNWRMKPVNGILSQREFFYSLAFRTFCSTQYIRHHSKPDYTPEPDLLHEFLGHVPSFLDPTICDISQKIGIMSLGATDAQIEALGAIYWFTLEFGLCKEGDDIKFYGAGPGGSTSECEQILKLINKNPDYLFPLDIINNPVPTHFIIQDVQPFYYVADSFDSVMEQIKQYSQFMHKPFNLKYDHKTNSYEVDRSILMKPIPSN